MNGQDRELMRLHRELKDSKPGMVAPVDLHESIMRAVRTKTRRPSRMLEGDVRNWQPDAVRRFALGAAGVCAGAACLWLILHAGQRSELRKNNLAAVNATFVAAVDIPNKVKPLEPLENELELLRRDIESAADRIRGASPL